MSDVLRYYPLVGDGFQPRLRPGSGVLAAPVDRYLFDGIYVLKDGAIYWAEKYVTRPVVRMWLENPVYGSHDVDLVWFNANVAALTVAEVNCRVREFPRVLPEWASAGSVAKALALPAA